MVVLEVEFYQCRVRMYMRRVENIDSIRTQTNFSEKYNTLQKNPVYKFSML